MSNLLTALAIKMMILLPLPGPELSAQLDPALLEKSSQIDVVSVAGKFSHAEYRQYAATRIESTEFPAHSIAPVPIPFGHYLLHRDKMSRTGDSFCGYLLPLARSGDSVNLLSFDEVAVTGHFSGTWRLAFADDSLAALQDNVVIGALGNSGTHRFKLAQLYRKADLSRARHLVLLLDSKNGSARVTDVTFSRPTHAEAGAGRGIWIWRRDKVLGQEDDVLRRLARRGVQKVYLQVADDPEVFANFLRKAAHAGISVYALDGSPGYLAAPHDLMARMKRVEEYNVSHPDARYAGFQIDIEPYLNRDFNSRKAYYANAYLELLGDLKRNYALPLSVVVPFWFDTLHAGGKSLLQGIVERADEVVVMSYRTDARAVLDISRSALSLGEQFGKPVWLAAELGPIADEHHREFNRCSPGSPGALKLDASWWCSAGEYQVPGSRISFRTKMEELPSFLQTAIPFASFRGWVLHSYEELPSADE